MSRLLWSTLLFLCLFAASVMARPAITRDNTPLREGPSRTTALVSELPARTRLEVVGEKDGWMQVQVPDGRAGYVWPDHLAASEGEARVPERRPDMDARASDLLDEVRTLRSEVNALRERPEPATAADLERVRAEVAQLAQSSRELSQRLGPGLGTDPPADGVPGASLAFLVAGFIVGWAASRAAQRRDRRQRTRLRI